MLNMSVIVFAALLASCSTSDSDSSSSGSGSSSPPRSKQNPKERAVKFRVVSKGATAVAANADGPEDLVTKSVVMVARSEEEYRRIWQRDVREGETPAIDFKRETAVFLLVGQRRTGGYGVSGPRKVTIRNGKLRIDAAPIEPKKEAMVTMAITAPWVLLAIPKEKLSEAEWVDGAGKTVARHRAE